MVYNNILDDQRIDNGRRKGNPYKLIAWIVVSATVLILTIFACVLFMEVMRIHETSRTLGKIHRGLRLVPVSFVFNTGIFAAYLVFFSQTFNRHLQGQILKAIALAMLCIVIAFFAFTMYRAIDSSYIYQKMRGLEYWLEWGVFIIGYTIPAAIAYYFAWEKRLYILLIAVFIALVLIQSFMMMYIYPHPHM